MRPDFCFDDGMPALYKKLCRHYFDIDPKATAFCVNAYRHRGFTLEAAIRQAGEDRAGGKG